MKTTLFALLLACLILLAAIQPAAATPTPLCTAVVENVFPDSTLVYRIGFHYWGSTTLENVAFQVGAGSFYRMTYITAQGQQITLVPNMNAVVTLPPDSFGALYYEGGMPRPAESLILQTEQETIPCQITVQINGTATPTATFTVTMTPTPTHTQTDALTSGLPVAGSLPDLLIADVRLMPNTGCDMPYDPAVTKYLLVVVANYGSNATEIETILTISFNSTVLYQRGITPPQAGRVQWLYLPANNLPSTPLELHLDAENRVKETSEENNTLTLTAEQLAATYHDKPRCTATPTPTFTATGPTRTATPGPSPTPTAT